MLVFWGVLGCPAGTDRNDPKFVSWVDSPTNGERRIQPTFYRGELIYFTKVPAGHPIVGTWGERVRKKDG